MKQIENYAADKYSNEAYKEVEANIYRILDEDDEDLFVTSLSFVQEPELKEGSSPAEISDYPLEDIMDKFYCHISDFYTELNEKSEEICYLEFGSPELVDVVNLRSIIGKHVYNVEDGDNVTLVIE
ncbi:MAG: hypothetical protein IKC46_04630 [Lachnospiraceae bacterium]|nr:hypothetical protein [Lachnospiraceae bacterium]